MQSSSDMQLSTWNWGLALSRISLMIFYMFLIVNKLPCKDKKQQWVQYSVQTSIVCVAWARYCLIKLIPLCNRAPFLCQSKSNLLMCPCPNIFWLHCTGYYEAIGYHCNKAITDISVNPNRCNPLFRHVRFMKFNNRILRRILIRDNRAESSIVALYKKLELQNAMEILDTVSGDISAAPSIVSL